MNSYFAALLIIGMATSGLAQAPTASPTQEPLPPGPWPARAPDLAAWTITMTSHPPTGAGDSNDKKPVILNKTVVKTGKALKTGKVIKTGNIYYEEMTDTTGKKWKSWINDGTALTFWPSLGAYLPGGFDGGFARADYTKNDFAEVNWLTESNYVNVGQYGGSKCFVFSKKSSVLVSGPPPSDPQHPTLDTPPPAIMSEETWTAYLDAKTLLPLCVQKGNLTYTYTYLPAPPVPLELPSDVQAELDKRAPKAVAPVPKAF